MTTIRDVARRAGVGRGTVSRVLNDSSRVDPATRRRVLAAISELDFTPSLLGRRFSLGRTLTVGVVVYFLTRPAVVERLRGIEFALASTPYDLTVFNVETVDRRDAVMRDLFRSGRIDGVIVVSFSPRDQDVLRIRQSAVPTVLIDAYHRGLPRIVVDDVAGGKLAVQHLLDLGHRRIAFLGDMPRGPFGFSSSRLRHQGVRKRLRDAGLSLPEAYVRVGEHSRPLAREFAGELLSLPVPPTAIVCASDTQALGALAAARELGRRVPEDVSIVGYDDIEIAGLLGLTTVRQPLFESGVRGSQWLLELMDGTRPSDLREGLDLELVIRTSTGPATS
jgi:DNA-binding LacI/PurR family transcriptional regulator